MNIVLLESLAVSDAKIAGLAAPLIAAGHRFTAYTDGNYDPAVLIERAKDADILMVASTRLPAEVVAACPRLKLISVAFTGVDHLPMDLCRERGILVSNCAGYSNQSVAELVFGLVLSLLRRIPACNEACRSGGTKAGLVGFELAGKTFGVIGYGRIGRAAAKLAAAFGMEVLAFDKFAQDDGVARMVTLDELLAQSDVISLHCPLFPDTQGIINRESIAKMKDGVLLINTSRGPLIVEEDLAAALHSGKVAGAGLDVLAVEPARMDNPLLKEENCLVTPHIAWAPKESRQRLMDIAVENLKAFLAGAPQNVVNA